MHCLANKVKGLKSKLSLFNDYPSDHTIVMQKLPELIALIEDVEAFSVICRKTVAGYQKELPFYTGLIDKTNEINGRNFLSGIEKNVTVNSEDGYLKLVLFPLIKNLSSKTKDYLSLLISDALKEYFSCHKKPNFSGKNCVLIINSLYAKPEQIRDNDSVEVAAIINAIKPYFLTDDDGIHLSIYRTGTLSDRHETEVYLMEEHDFVFWLLSVAGTQQTE